MNMNDLMALTDSQIMAALDAKKGNSDGANSMRCTACKRCTNCVDCNHCDDCTGCSSCDSCFDCCSCSSCTACTGCSMCNDCHACYDLAGGSNRINNRQFDRETYLAALELLKD